MIALLWIAFLYLKAWFIQKIKFCHHLSTVILFQTRTMKYNESECWPRAVKLQKLQKCCTTLAKLVFVRVIVSVHVCMCMNVYKLTTISKIETEKRKNPWNRCLDQTSEMASTVRLYQIWPRLKHQALSVHKYLENFQGKHKVTRNLSFLWIFLNIPNFVMTITFLFI